MTAVSVKFPPSKYLYKLVLCVTTPGRHQSGTTAKVNILYLFAGDINMIKMYQLK